MHTTASLHVHPACASKPLLIERIQAETGRVVIVANGQAQLQMLNPPDRRRLFELENATSPARGSAA